MLSEHPFMLQLASSDITSDEAAMLTTAHAMSLQHYVLPREQVHGSRAPKAHSACTVPTTDLEVEPWLCKPEKNAQETTTRQPTPTHTVCVLFTHLSFQQNCTLRRLGGWTSRQTLLLGSTLVAVGVLALLAR